MRLFRPMLLFVIVIALAASQASAQGRRYRGGRGMGPGMMNQGSVPGVQLTADQRSRIAAIRQETRTKVASIMSNTNLSPGEKQTQAQAAREAGHQKVMNVLTPEQRNQFNRNWSSLNPQQSAANDTPAPPGKAIFDQNCARCHGADGNAVAGWRTRVSSMTLADVQNRIKNGIDGMPAFKGALTEKQIKEVASYAKSLAAGNNK